MQQPVLTRAVEKLAHAGEQAGFTVEDMIRMLNAGVSVESLLDIIERSLRAPEVPVDYSHGSSGSSRWIM
jgi:hypothetical protein